MRSNNNKSDLRTTAMTCKASTTRRKDSKSNTLREDIKSAMCGSTTAG